MQVIKFSLEIRLPSNVSYKAILTANKSLGTAVYREYFSVDSTFYRKEKQLGTIQLTSDEYYEMIFYESSIANVYSCYLYSDLDPYELAAFTKVDVKGVEKGSGHDSYSYGAEPQFTKRNSLLSLSGVKGLAASRSEILEEEFELASPSELESKVASESDTTRTTEVSENDEETSETIIYETKETSDIEESETEETSENEESEIEETIVDDESGKYLNAKGIDTPKIYDESDATNSTYVLELKNYDKIFLQIIYLKSIV